MLKRLPQHVGCGPGFLQHASVERQATVNRRKKANVECIAFSASVQLLLAASSHHVGKLCNIEQTLL